MIDCEGAGEMFRVTTLPLNSTAKPEQDFFGTPTYLTVSGQVRYCVFELRIDREYSYPLKLMRVLWVMYTLLAPHFAPKTGIVIFLECRDLI